MCSCRSLSLSVVSLIAISLGFDAILRKFGISANQLWNECETTGETRREESWERSLIFGKVIQEQVAMFLRERLHDL